MLRGCFWPILDSALRTLFDERNSAITAKAPVRVVLKIGIFEDIFNNRVRTLVRVVLKTGVFEDIFKTARNRFEERSSFLQNDFPIGRFEE